MLVGDLQQRVETLVLVSCHQPDAGAVRQHPIGKSNEAARRGQHQPVPAVGSKYQAHRRRSIRWVSQGTAFTGGRIPITEPLLCQGETR